MIESKNISIRTLKNSPESMVNQSVYFLGIGGIGMSALARYFKEIGWNVSGYDKTETVLTKQLVSEGIAICYVDTVDCIDMKANLVVYTPAIPSNHEGFVFYNNNGYNLLKRSEVLGWVTGSMFSICVAGTHGKTTTSSLIAHILRDSGYGCNAFLGGIAANYQTNFWSSKKQVAVAEADEYDRSFLQLTPNIAVLTSMDPDHLDIYGDENTMQDAFIAFTTKIVKDGLLLSRAGVKRESELQADKHLKYGVETKADIVANNIRVVNGTYHFDVVAKNVNLENVQLNMGGLHNIENATAAIGVALHLGIDDQKILKALKSFKGVKRRFEFIVKSKDVVFIDDYAHHPGELNALIQGVKQLYPTKKITVAFQPHLYSRTKDFADGFANALNKVDEVILLPIYPARELPMEGVNSEMIASKMSNKVNVVEKKEFLNAVQDSKPEVFVTVGAGDIDLFIEPIKKMLSE